MANETLIFETKRVIVREYMADDLTAVHDFAQHAEVVQYQNWGPNKLSDTEVFLKKVMSWSSDNLRMSYGFCIASKENNEAMGGCGIYLNKENQDKGLILNYKNKYELD